MVLQLPKKLSSVITRFREDEQALIKEAYFFARKKHHGQRRKSGSAYILHPLRIAERIARDNYDSITTTAALLHDTLEDTATTEEELREKFGSEVAGLVDGVTKVSAIRVKGKKLASKDEALFLSEAGNYRKLLLAMSQDVRVIIIRLYDRLDNVQTLDMIAAEKRQFYARETIETYAPIADRLGMGVVKGELEDISFPYAYPEEHKSFVKIARTAYKNPQRVISEAKPIIEKMLLQNSVRDYSINGRAKHLFSLYSKMSWDNKKISEIYDIAALRIIVNTVEDCYKVLGLIHDLFKPVPDRIKDYIAQPKTSGYQSLHTTVQDTNSNIFEIQVRTKAMHDIAEFGPAAHWSYKDSVVEKNLKLAQKNREEWLGELQKVRSSNDREFLRELREEFFAKQVFVFTPKGKIISLPKGSCGIDFAFRIHSELGSTCSGVKINDRLMPLGTELKTGDVVEIITSKKTSPSTDWLKFVKTSNAKHHIKAIIRLKNYPVLAKIGEQAMSELIAKYKLEPLDKQKALTALTNSTLPYYDLESAYVAVAERTVHKIRLLKVWYPNLLTIEKRKTKLATSPSQGIIALKDIRHVFAGCCRPKADNSNLIGYICRDHIIKVHKKSCKRIADVDERRLIEL